MDRAKLQSEIETFIDKKCERFRLTELADYLKIEFPELQVEELKFTCEAVKQLELVHYLDSINIDWYIRRDHLFNGSEFAIKVTKLELENNILFAGHRFMPFCNPNITPGNIILQDQSKNTVEHHGFDISILDAAIYHSLFGRLGMLGVYTFDNEDNSKKIEASGYEAFINLPVFDMTQFFADNKLSSDDLIIIEIMNWKAGLVRIKDIKRATDLQTNFAGINYWIEAFNESLVEVCDNFGVATTAEYQLERIFASDPMLLMEPVVHIGGALQLGHTFAIQDLGGNCVLWNKNEDPEECLSLTDYTDEPFDHSSEPMVDQVLIALGVPYSSGEIEALVRNEFFKKTNATVDQIYTLYFTLFKTDLGPDNITVIKDFIESVKDDVTSSYNAFADNNAGLLRTDLISLKVKMVEWLVVLEASINDINELPTKKILQFTEIMSYVTQSMLMCNNSNEVISKTELEVNLARLRELSDNATYLMEDINSSNDNN